MSDQLLTLMTGNYSLESGHSLFLSNIFLHLLPSACVICWCINSHLTTLTEIHLTTTKAIEINIISRVAHALTNCSMLHVKKKKIKPFPIEKQVQRDFFMPFNMNRGDCQ